MAKMKPVLGRGLAALIPRTGAAPALPAGGHDDGVSTDITASIPLERIQHNPYQPRADFDPVALDELKRSIQEKGIIQPVTVRRVSDGYQLISGERRVRAAREAGLREIPAYIIRVRANEEMLELALIENLQREHLNPVEIAISYKRLIDECKYTQEEVSQKIGKDRTTVTNFLRLLRLPEPVQSALRRGTLSTGHARALLAIEDEQRRMEVFRRAVERGLSVRDIERMAREKKGKSPRGGRSPRSSSAAQTSLASIEDRLRQFLGTRVHVRMLQEGKGEIVIEFYSSDELERILELFAEMEDRRQ